MKYIISGTNRPGSRTLKIAKLVQRLYADNGENVEVIDLCDVGLELLQAAAPYGDVIPDKMRTVIRKLTASDGIVIVCPEYNGSMPGALKYFIDHWIYPDTYEFRPFALIGLGSRFGGLRPVEHLQGSLGFRNAYIYPERVFITDVFKVLDANGELTDTRLLDLLKSQTKGFLAFTRALVSNGIDANSRLKGSSAAKP